MIGMKPAALADADRESVAALADRLRALAAEAAGDDGAAVRLEWSQAGTQHSGRLEVAGRRLTVPAQITAAMAQLRAQMAAPRSGTWLSVLLEVSADDVDIAFNYTLRPYWNSTGATMLEPPPAALGVPDESRWAADLRRYPRDREHVVTWMAAPVIDSDSIPALRQALTNAGFVAGGVKLPGEEQIPFEGSVTMLQHSRAHYSVQISDYGQHEFLAEYASEENACRAVWDYLTQPLPQPVPIPAADLEQRAAAAGDAYTGLQRRLASAGPGGVVTNLATGVPFDRIGVLDGLYFFGWGTPWPQRSLPDSANGPGAQTVVLMAARPVEVQAEIVPPWFDQPGGGIRFRVEDAARQGLRDLVRAGVLIQVQPT